FTWHGIAFGPKEVGYLFAYFGFLGIIIQGFLIGRLVKWQGERRLAFTGFACCVFGYVVLSIIHNPLWIILTGLFTSFGNGVIRPVLISEISGNVDRTEQGVVLGINQSMNSIAQVTAPILATYLIGREWLTDWALLPGSLCAVALVLILYTREKAARENQQVSL